jgi:proton glutamate symport protein
MMASIRKILLNPLFLFPVTLLAIYVGIKAPALGFAVAPVGTYYISLMKMIVLPYLFVTITLGIARVASNPKAAEYTRRIVITYPLTLIFVAFFGLGVAMLLPPAGFGNAGSMASMGNLVNGSLESAQSTGQDTVSLTNSKSDTKIEELKIFDRFVPRNIFEALSNGDTLKVVIFCIIFGAAMAREVDKDTEDLFGMFKAVQASCVQVIYWITLVLPFALFPWFPLRSLQLVWDRCYHSPHLCSRRSLAPYA